MACPFYYWNNHYACRKSGNDVDEDTYYKYCRNYDYDFCPIFKQELPSDSRCYLTSACIQACNLPDDCRELTVLRWFRDNFVIKTEPGRLDVEHYYEVAPLIVQNMNQEKDKIEKFKTVYLALVLPCVDLIEAGKYTEAYNLYKGYSQKLEDQYVRKLL